MLKVASFKIGDAEGMNKLLEKYRLAPGATILVSEGQVCIPYEDGQEPNTAQRILAMQEERNGFIKQLELLEHSQEVLTIMRDSNAPATDKDGTTESSYEAYEVNKQRKLVETEKAKNYTSFDNTIKNNMHEVNRLKVNLEVFNRRIKELQESILNLK